MKDYTPWEDYEKYRAEQHKQLGCVLLTPLAAMLLGIFIGSPHYDFWYFIKLFIASMLARIGWFYIDNSFKIMYSREKDKLYGK